MAASNHSQPSALSVVLPCFIICNHRRSAWCCRVSSRPPILDHSWCSRDDQGDAAVMEPSRGMCFPVSFSRSGGSRLARRRCRPFQGRPGEVS